VLISGDEEYRSEEFLPQLARYCRRHGFTCTVLFAVNPADGTIDPDNRNNIPAWKPQGRRLMIISTGFAICPSGRCSGSTST